MLRNPPPWTLTLPTNPNEGESIIYEVGHWGPKQLIFTGGEWIVANYYSSARTNDFKVGTPKEFYDWVATLPGVEFQERHPGHPDLIGCLLVNDSDGAGWPTYRYDDETGEEGEIDIFNEIVQYLAPGEVVIFQEVGAEKLRYLVGYSVAVNSEGDIIKVSIDDIYQQAKAQWAESMIR